MRKQEIIEKLVDSEKNLFVVKEKQEYFILKAEEIAAFSFKANDNIEIFTKKEFLKGVK
ncbi:MAG: hypothetical protein ACRC0Y_08945 [Fusobacteriaceae bacterium]